MPPVLDADDGLGLGSTDGATPGMWGIRDFVAVAGRTDSPLGGVPGAVLRSDSGKDLSSDSLVRGLGWVYGAAGIVGGWSEVTFGEGTVLIATSKPYHVLILFR